MTAGTSLGRPPDDGATLDRLAGEWWIHQSRRGHRYATDDVVTAAAALAARPDAASVLDLGAGVGALGLLVLLGLSETARLVAVEVQPTSAALMRRTVAHNGLEARVEVREGDLRGAGVVPGGTAYDLVVANPPYVAVGTATASPHPARAAARQELHGDVHDYCETAARHLAPSGVFCFCHVAADPRPERAVAAVGLSVRSRHEVAFREGRPPLLAVYTCGRGGRREDPPPLVVRHADGRRTEAIQALRRRLLIEA